MKKSGRNRSAKAASLTMLILGAAALVVSVLYAFILLAFVGLGLTFWGAVLLYIRPEDYTKTAVLDASLLPSLVTLNQMLQELDYKGDAVYLPPKYSENPENTKIYIPKQKDAALPVPEQIQKYENQLFLKNPSGVLLEPPGAELTKLFERTLETSFTRIDLEYLQQNMPKLFIESLEIAENLEMEAANGKVTTKITESVSLLQAKNNTLRVTITNSIYNEICKETSKLSQIHDKVGCPLCSAIACALTKASGKPVTIDKTEFKEDGKTIEVSYTILEE